VTEEAKERGRVNGGMSRRAAAWLAWSLWVLCLALIGLTGLLGYATSQVPKWEMPAALAVLYGLLSITYPTAGALIASRRPGNAVGWIFCLIGLLLIMSSLVEAYTNFSLFAQPAPLPATPYAAWLTDSDFEFAGIATAFALLLLLYPDGRLLARGWGIAAWGVVIGCLLWVLEWGDVAGPTLRLQVHRQPVRHQRWRARHRWGARRVRDHTHHALLDGRGHLVGLSLGTCGRAGAAAAQVVRLRRSPYRRLHDPALVPDAPRACSASDCGGHRDPALPTLRYRLGD
jgi:hypothetical protein